MDMLSKYLSRITSSLYSCILLWKAKLPFPLKNETKRHRTGKAGLETLVRSQEKSLPRVVHRCTAVETAEPKLSSPPRRLSSLWSTSLPAFQTTMIGDVIGTESGDCMVSDIGEVRAEAEAGKARYRERSERKREFPPPITVLRETGRMPWALNREYSGDGRLIITAQRVGRHECCMEARREDGRLAMKFVSGFEFNEGLESVDDEVEEFEEELVNECITYDAAGPRGFFQLHHSDSLPNSCSARPASEPLRPMTHVM